MFYGAVWRGLFVYNSISLFLLRNIAKRRMIYGKTEKTISVGLIPPSYTKGG